MEVSLARGSHEVGWIIGDESVGCIWRQRGLVEVDCPFGAW